MEIDYITYIYVFLWHYLHFKLCTYSKEFLQCDVIVILSTDLRILFSQIIVLLLKSSILFLGIILDNFFLSYFFIPGNKDYYLLILILVISDLLISYFKCIKKVVDLLMILVFIWNYNKDSLNWCFISRKSFWFLFKNLK